MGDKDLPGYCWFHCRTERAMFHVSHLRRLYELAGETGGPALDGDGFISAHADVLDEVIAKAERNLRAKAVAP